MLNEYDYGDPPPGPDETRPSLDDDAPLIVAEHFYLEAMRMLGNAEGDEARFEFTRAAHEFGRSELVQKALAQACDGTVPAIGEATLDVFALGVAVPYHHNRYYERWLDAIREADPRVAGVVRSAAFSFMTAWTHRYGGIRGNLTDNCQYIKADRRS